MEDQQEFRKEVLDFMGLGSCMPREAWRLPPPNLFSSLGRHLTNKVVKQPCRSSCNRSPNNSQSNLPWLHSNMACR